MSHAAADLRSDPITFRVAGDVDAAPDDETTILTLSRSDALDLVAWVGLPRDDWGALDSTDLAARCRRRLWPEERNFDREHVVRDRRGGIVACRLAGALRGWTERLLGLTQRAGEQPILFA
jgi:hypothetical protein